MGKAFKYLRLICYSVRIMLRRTKKSGYKLMAIFIFIYFSMFRMSGQDTFDVYSYRIPEGFKVDKTDQSVILSSSDGTLSILLLPSKPCTDIAYTEFGRDWTLYVTSKYSVLGFPNRIVTLFPGDWEMTTGQAKVFNDEATLWIQLRNFTKQGIKATVLFYAVDDKQQETIKGFIDNLKLSDKNESYELLSGLNSAGNTTHGINAQLNDNKPGVEIWMRIKMGGWNMSGGYYTGNYYDLSKNKMGYTILFPDGSYTGDEIPRKGFLGFSRLAPESSAYSWGNYIKEGNILLLKSDYGDLKLNFRSDDVLENPSSTFLYYKCKDVDGLRLNGSWSYIPNSEKDPYYDEPGCRQVIYFSDDMKFDDRGAFVSDCRYPDRIHEDAPGKGTYRLNNFTLILEYDDGRIVHKSFTGALMNDPFINSDIIYIGGINFFRRGKADRQSSPLSSQANVTEKDHEGVQKYGNFRYKVPPGWITKESPQFLELYPASLKDKEIFSILLLKGKTSSLLLQTELEHTWDEIAAMLGAQKLKQVNGNFYNEDETGKTLAGWEYISGHGSIRSNGDFFVHAYIIKANEKTERVIILAKEIWLDGVRNNIDPTIHHYPYYLTITDFIFNLGFDSFPSKELAKPSIKGTGITGVWSGLGLMGGQLKTTFLIFFTNGQVYYGSRFPVTGLNGLDTYADKERSPRYWGTYEFKDGAGIIKMSYGTFPVRIEGNNLIVRPVSEEHKFIRMPSFDGLKLEGKWMIEGQNEQPVSVTFRKDGTFIDEGALKVLDHSLYEYYSIADRGGSGRYLIADHTVIFNYSDGRILKIAFPGTGIDPGNPSPKELILSFNYDVLVLQ